MAAAGDGTHLVSDPSEDEAPAILAGTLVVTGMALVTLGARLYVRLAMIKNFGWDDAFMSFAMALTVAGQGIVIAEVSHGAGRHIGDVDPAVYMIGMKLNFITQPLYLVAICVVKLSIGSSLLRIASTKFYKTLIISIMGFMAFYTTGCFFTIVFQCTDIRMLWDGSVKGTCWTQRTLQALSYTNLALNIMTDLLFAVVIPTPMLWGLNVNRRTRITLMGILGLGVFACAACFIKLGYLVNYGKLGDWLWDSRNITIWTVVECNIGIIAGSLPTLRPLFKTILGSTYGKGSRKTGGPSGSGYYGKGTIKGSKSNWQSLGSGRGGVRGGDTDETSSERAFNAGVAEAYEMGGRSTGGPNGMTVLTEVDAKSSDESVDRAGLHARGGITKTTTTTMTFLDLKKS
ncbi:Integral membrane family protein [Pleurostoma richardsiae]|uniref:Integral membrane family protein n=1 Tax=Pleurostoma richardsiae TaxID=41990 RepID=A0AA38VLQ7_9PEZI|nr:Integral membrane family protein [Pleurostoma richardsiae]